MMTTTIRTDGRDSGRRRDGHLAQSGERCHSSSSQRPCSDLRRNCRDTEVELVAPPFAHAHEQVEPARPAHHGVHDRRSRRRRSSSTTQGTKFQAMTFNGSMPGPLMIVHEGDYVELTLVNPDDQHDAAQHRLPLGNRGAGRRRR